MKIGQNIKKYRKARKLTQSQLAKLLGKDMRTIQKYEYDEISPPLRDFEKLARELKVEVVDLLYGDNKPFYPVPEFMSKELVINIRLKVSPDGFIDVEMD